MGAWGIGNFENDMAGDWLYELGEYLDSDIASGTLATIKLLLKLLLYNR